jgi:hypothetical protein
MRRIKVAGLALVAVLAAGAMATDTASAAKLTLSEGGVALLPGDYFEMWGTENLQVSTSEGSPECNDPSTGLEVSVLTNSKNTDELRIEHLFGTELVCRSDFGNTYVYLRSLGNTLKLRSNGKASSGEVALDIVYEQIEYHEQRYEGVTCSFPGKHLTGTNTASTSRQRLEVQLGGELRLDSAGSSENAKHLCPKTADIDLSLPKNENHSEAFGEVEAQT